MIEFRLRLHYFPDSIMPVAELWYGLLVLCRQADSDLARLPNADAMGWDDVTQSQYSHEQYHRYVAS